MVSYYFYCFIGTLYLPFHFLLYLYCLVLCISFFPLLLKFCCQIIYFIQYRVLEFSTLYCLYRSFKINAHIQFWSLFCLIFFSAISIALISTVYIGYIYVHYLTLLVFSHVFQEVFFFLHLLDPFWYQYLLRIYPNQVIKYLNQ